MANVFYLNVFTLFHSFIYLFYSVGWMFFPRYHHHNRCNRHHCRWTNFIVYFSFSLISSYTYKIFHVGYTKYCFHIIIFLLFHLFFSVILFYSSSTIYFWRWRTWSVCILNGFAFFIHIFSILYHSNHKRILLYLYCISKSHHER